MTRDQIFDEALRVVTCGEIRTERTPVIFTSCRKAEAERFVEENPDYAVIHSMPAGKRLEELSLFDHMSPKLAYLHWFLLSSRLIVENDFPEQALFFANPENPSSTAFGIEIPLLYHAKPHVQSIHNPLTGVTTEREQWESARLMRPYVLEMANIWMCGPGQGDLSSDERVLMDKFAEAADGLPTTQDPLEFRTEYALKLMIPGYLGQHGNLPADFRRGMNPLSFAMT